jgi:hypothetical protein
VAGHEQDQAGRAVPVAEAAAQLGVIAETLRKRLWRGQVPGVKLDGQWFVYADHLHQNGTGPVPDTAGQPAGLSCPEQDSEQDTAPLVEQRESENAGLRAQLEAPEERRDLDGVVFLGRLREAPVQLA